ncbi:MAG TPA: MBL fold metallo-hydrolase [Solirubrobacteraceae bacterium]|jgi:glyoxylase-like metal-dependent hydrolase (beta-lactamase superfamily II)
MRVAEGVEQFTNEGLVNWFVVETDEGPVAVDAGFPTAWKDIEHRAGELRAIVVTHGHADHVGFAPIAEREHGIPVYVPERDEKLVRSPLPYAKSERLPLLYLHHAATRRVYWRAIRAIGIAGQTVKSPRTYRDGDELPGGLRAVFTPGHTKGHMALHLPDRDLVFAGDAIVTWDIYTDRRGPRLIARAATWSSEENLRSLDRIAETGAGTLVCGHGDPWREGAAAAAGAAREAGAA